MNIGETVTVEMPNFSAVLTGPNAHLDSKTFKVTGKVIAPPAWLKDKEHFALFVADSPVPVRVFDRRRVISIDGIQVSQEIDTSIRSFAIKGSKGEYYTVLASKNAWTCTCVGFQFRKYCKHIDEAKSKQ